MTTDEADNLAAVYVISAAEIARHEEIGGASVEAEQESFLKTWCCRFVCNIRCVACDNMAVSAGDVSRHGAQPANTNG